MSKLTYPCQKCGKPRGRDTTLLSASEFGNRPIDPEREYDCGQCADCLAAEGRKRGSLDYHGICPECGADIIVGTVEDHLLICRFADLNKTGRRGRMLTPAPKEGLNNG